MTRTEMKQDARRGRKGDVLTVVGAMLLGAVLAFVLVNIQDLHDELRIANQARDALASQVQGLGATPVAGQPGNRGDIGPSGPAGPVGPVGPTGKTGATGKPGATGTPGPTGASGASGVPGATGASGAAGKDGTDGTDGKNGSSGNPPAGWTWTDPNGVKYSCEPVGDFDSSAPRYSCTSQPTPVPTESTLVLLTAVSMAAYRRRIE